MTDLTPVPDRLTYVLVEKSVGNTPAEYALNPERVEAAAVKDATLVCSRTQDGVHAPVLDIDRAAALTRSPAGLTLWVEGLTARTWRGVRAVLREAHVGGRIPRHLAHLRRHPAPSARRRAYDGERHRSEDGATLAAALRAIGPTLDASFADLVSSARAATTLGTTHGLALSDPWPLPLETGAMLLPSTSNHHLYLETTLPWSRYEQMLHGLAGHELLEPGYVAAACARHGSYLRLPWVTKADPLTKATVPF